MRNAGSVKKGLGRNLEGRRESERYKEWRRRYNELCEKKKKEDSEKWLEVAKQAKSEGQVWEVVNRKRKRG